MSVESARSIFSANGRSVYEMNAALSSDTDENDIEPGVVMANSAGGTRKMRAISATPNSRDDRSWASSGRNDNAFQDAPPLNTPTEYELEPVWARAHPSFKLRICSAVSGSVVSITPAGVDADEKKLDADSSNVIPSPMVRRSASIGLMPRSCPGNRMSGM